MAGLNELKPEKDKIPDLRQGIQAAWPICLGYVPIGMAFGVLAQKAGLSLLEIAIMSVFVFAGSSQFIAISMLSAGAASAAIILTTFVVNLRHLLMSSSLAVFLNKEKRWKLSLFAYGVTDESFAINHVRFGKGGWDLNHATALNFTANLTWIGSTITGGYGGQFIEAGSFGIDYALVAMFICLLVFQLKASIYIVTAGIAGVLAVVLSLVIPGNSYIFISSVLAAGLGLVIKRRIG